MQQLSDSITLRKDSLVTRILFNFKSSTGPAQGLESVQMIAHNPFFRGPLHKDVLKPTLPFDVYSPCLIPFLKQYSRSLPIRCYQFNPQSFSRLKALNRIYLGNDRRNPFTIFTLLTKRRTCSRTSNLWFMNSMVQSLLHPIEFCGDRFWLGCGSWSSCWYVDWVWTEQHHFGPL